MVSMYGTAEVEEISGISAFTIRYYDKCGFFPNLQRDSHGIRLFSDSDIRQLRLVDALRKSGLSIEGIQYFVKLEGKAGSQDEIAGILADRLKVLAIKKSEIDESIALLSEAIKSMQNADEDQTY